ncbi:hypothetical protein KGMB03357_01560 [Anaerotignum faecicola]|uniref:Uncharacterized protein n=1 Tax=Anaerotignum faecicola TaxID=2358141 RepID=A0A401LAR6_9FIRM|nr:hypothetical protein KGMB03357_01560 [Anaerotignum faecicola]
MPKGIRDESNRGFVTKHPPRKIINNAGIWTGDSFSCRNKTATKVVKKGAVWVMIVTSAREAWRVA